MSVEVNFGSALPFGSVNQRTLTFEPKSLAVSQATFKVKIKLTDVNAFPRTSSYSLFVSVIAFNSSENQTNYYIPTTNSSTANKTRDGKRI